MVEVIERYKDKISGQIFDNIEDAVKSEIKSSDIKIAFGFYDRVEDDGLRFANGNYCIQRTEFFYNKLLDTIIKMVQKHEPYITKQYNKSNISLTKNSIKGLSILGRFLDGGNSQLYKWWTIQMNICPVCYREYGQSYYALNCKHDDQIPTKGA